MKTGENIGGYELLERIAQGGMGTIWKARHPHLERLVAIKQIRAEVRNDEMVRDAFLREVKNLSRLHSPQIVQVMDCGITAEGSPYMVTEFLEGEDLRQKLDRESSVSVRETLSIGIDVLKALAEAHGVGLVHRDLKPGNIFLQQLAGESEPAVKVLDFGVAKLMSNDGVEAQLQPSMGTKGSPRFMAPEQIQNQKITPAADIYSFGATLYRMVTGEHMFRGGPLDVLRRHVDSVPRPVRELAPDAGIPEELEDLIAGCLMKVPEDRPLSAAALRSRLEVIISRLTTTAHDIASESSLGRPQGTPTDDISLPDWFESTTGTPMATNREGDGLTRHMIDGVEVRNPDDSLDGSVLDWSAGAVIGGGDDGDLSADDALASQDTIAEFLAPPDRDFDMVATVEEAHSNQFLENLRSQPIEPVLAQTDPLRDAQDPPSSEEGERELSREQLIFGGGLAALLVLGLGLGFGLSPDGVSPAPEPIKRDASVSEWIKKVGTEIREKEKKTDRSVPTVVRRWANIDEGPAGRVTLEIEQGPGKFIVRKTGAVLCDQTVECLVPILHDIKVIKAGFRSEKISRDELSDRRETRWKITLRR